MKTKSHQLNAKLNSIKVAFDKKIHDYVENHAGFTANKQLTKEQFRIYTYSAYNCSKIEGIFKGNIPQSQITILDKFLISSIIENLG